MDPTVSINPCPPADEWGRFLKNAISDWDQVRHMARHLETCSKCGSLYGKKKDLSEGCVPTLEHISGKETKECGNAPEASPGNKGNFPHEVQAILEPATEPGCLGKIGDYNIVRVLGEGGMGLVLEAEDPGLKRKVAIKILRPETSLQEKNRLRFLQEARSAAAIEHENIVTIYQVGEHKKFPYLAMQYLRGETLTSRIQRGKIPHEEALRIALQAAQGLAAAHDQGLIHRDIKPDNLWLESDEKGGEWQKLKILDFGLAKAVENDELNITAQGIILGTPYFMSPEQASGFPLSIKSDIFSLGSVFYLMLTGKYPFPGGTTIAVLTSIANNQPKQISLVDTAVPGSFSALVSRMMEKKPANRPNDCHEIVNEIRKMCADLGFESGATSLRAQPKKWLAVSAGLFTLAALFFFFMVYLKNQNKQLVDQNKQLVNQNVPVPKTPIYVGILHDERGSMGVSGKSLIEATKYAIEKVNREGLIPGKEIIPVVKDGKSTESLYPILLEELVKGNNASVVFGCWTSNSRKALREKLKELDVLLLYPVQYEGMEDDKNIFYLGPCPNQQIIPALDCAVDTNILGSKVRKIRVVGSDYVFPRAAAEIIRVNIEGKNLERADGDKLVFLEPKFFKMGHLFTQDDMGSITKDKPELIINAINGSSNDSFFQIFRNNKEWDSIATISLSVGKQEFDGFEDEFMKRLKNDYAAWSYFQSLKDKDNQAFLEKYKLDTGDENKSWTDPMITAYYSVLFWTEAIRATDGDANTNKVREALKKVVIKDGPAGEMKIDPDTRHAHRRFFLGKIQPDRSFDIIVGKESKELIRPEPYPRPKDRKYWEAFLEKIDPKKSKTNPPSSPPKNP